MKVTAQMLRNANACESDVGIFENVWPNGTELNRASITEAVELGLDIFWFALYILPTAAWEAYDQAMAIPWRVYEKAALRELGRWDAARYAAVEAHSEDSPDLCRKVFSELRDAYKEAIIPACAAYDRAMIEALVLAARTMEGAK